ncbi:SusC/RagA family TonB-linked outer membrane protein [Croceitalea dokdonensis DOKDO 023]|uniref:SusC/RagA family TonB-linked outer membrane protein n=1 Tax=Croceitalea dokdonensis DOKDO 023 TaxID=1300341 RepID=A0A0N8H3H3_9FLAO|nr:TonB-dependent receptor [Croceitalea dokdonensis]KPM30572.1 SusC/RagA family TonB-linked outer membrane protein [Croceitalea dokdonensis DOKDO 023]
MKKKCNKRLRTALFSLLTVVALVCGGLSSVNAQVQAVSGTVTDVNGEPIPGVNVVQKGTSNGTSTDFDGNYSIRLIPGSRVMVFSYIGFNTKEVTVNAANINVALEEDTQNLDEVVVIGYATVAREKVLGALSSVKQEKIAQVTPTNAFEGVQGRLAGVQIATNGGPGAGFDIRVRGTSTFSAGGTGPLYVVDGQQLDNIDNIDPNDIASLEVLKDGATTAIYGTRGANGVVLITTKSGKSGEVSVDVNVVTGINSLNGAIPVANTRQRLFYEDVRRTEAQRQNPTGNDRDSLNLLLRNSFDLQDLVTRAGFRNQVNVAVSAGSDKVRAYWNTGFLNEDGIVVNSNFRRINTRFKLDFTPTKKLAISSSFNASFEEFSGLSENQVFQQLVERIAYFPIFEPNGDLTPEIAGRQNPVAEARLRELKLRTWRGQSFNSIQYRLTKNFSIKSTLGINFRLRRNNDFQPLLVLNPRNTNPLASFRDRIDYDLQQENFVNYNKDFGKHSVSSFAGMQILKRYQEEFGLSNIPFVSEDIRTFNNADPEGLAINNGQTFNTRSNLFSLFAGFKYDFDNRYLVGATIRRDGSSRFGEDNEFGYFPSAEIGWRVSNESFLKGNATLNNLLFRASYGETGNDRIGDFEFNSAFNPGAIYDGISGVSPTRLGNSLLSWESTNATNVGFDLGMFRNRLTVNFDVWRKDTEALLANVPIPEESGFVGIRQNVGGVRNQGIDLTVGGNIIQSKDFSWSSSFNVSFLENEVTRLAGGTPFFSGNYIIEEGESIGNIFGFKNLGVFQYDESNAFTDDGIQLTPNFDADGTFTNYTLNGQEFTGDVNQIRNDGRVAEGGDIIWEDIDGDFVITNDDRQVIGNGLPTTFGGVSNDFKYKDISLSFLFNFTLGNDIYRRWDELRNDLNSANETPGPDRIEGAWLNPGDVTVFPRLNRVPQNRDRPNSFFVTDGSFVRLSFVRLGYDLPKSALDRLGFIKKCSVFVSGNNLLTWTNYEGYNPELGTRGNPLQPGLDNLRFPNDREVIFGMNLKF